MVNRFTRLGNVSNVKKDNFVLMGAQRQTIPGTVVAVEGGRLAFVLPTTALQPASTYVLRINGVTDNAGRVLPDTSVTFETEGEPQDQPAPDWVTNSTWTNPGAITNFQHLPPLQAPPPLPPPTPPVPHPTLQT